MAYLKPPWFTRVIFNKVAMSTGIGGSETLTVTRRISKQPQKIPVVVPEVNGVKYLVSTRGEFNVFRRKVSWTVSLCCAIS